jgi:hypothetical protein
MQHTIHVPRLQSMVDALYLSIGTPKEINCAHLALLQSIIAVSVYFGTLETPPALLFTKAAFSADAEFWKNQLMSLISDCDFMVAPTFETIQALFILSYFAPSLGGGLDYEMSNLIRQARQLKLHEIDIPRSDSLSDSYALGEIDLELRRRVWWSLCVGDW